MWRALFLLTAATMYHFATDVLILRSVELGQQRALLTLQQRRSFVIFIRAIVSNNSAFSAHSEEEERQKFMVKLD
jgi:hypothetical protein